MIFFSIRAGKNARDAAAEADAQASARAAEQARQAEEARRSERQRVERGIVGEWYYADGQFDRRAVLKITNESGTVKGEYVSEIGMEPLVGVLLSDNLLKLTNARQSGKIVRPGSYYDGDFSQEAWVQLAGDGGSLMIRFSQAGGGRAIVLNRAPAGAGTDSAANQGQPKGDGIGTGSTSANPPDSAAKAGADTFRPGTGGSAATPTPAPPPRDSTDSRRAAAQRLTFDVESDWTLATAVINSGAPRTYFRAADIFRGNLERISTFTRSNGADTETRRLEGETRRRLADVLEACAAENRVNSRRGEATVPCP
jgi:hypothetical protein